MLRDGEEVRIQRRPRRLSRPPGRALRDHGQVRDEACGQSLRVLRGLEEGEGEDGHGEAPEEVHGPTRRDVRDGQPRRVRRQVRRVEGQGEEEELLRARVVGGVGGG